MNDGEFCTSPNREHAVAEAEKEGAKERKSQLCYYDTSGGDVGSVGRKEDSKVDLMSSFSCHFFCVNCIFLFFCPLSFEKTFVVT